jgi:hypothetical protein
MNRLALLITVLVLSVSGEQLLAQEVIVEPWRETLYQQWKALPQPPITPYEGPFGAEARAFFTKMGKTHPDPEVAKNWAAYNDFSHTAKNGVYDAEKDPREINRAFEAAILEDWRRMGYNCAYKGKYFTFYVGSYLKQKGLLGAIDQTLFGQGGPPPVQFDGKLGRTVREGCGSFFHPTNFEAGVAAMTGMGHSYGHHLFTVGDHKLTCSWDEVGLRSESMMDYHPNVPVEFRRYLKDVWFGDESPGSDSNGDSRTYNAFTGEKLTSWEQVEPIHVSLDWSMAGKAADGSPTFSAMKDVDAKLFEQPGRYKLLVDFHRYYTFEFFRRINEQASQRMNALGTPGRITCYPFVQHFIVWPGINFRGGNSYYWYHRLSPVVNVEHCWPESPAMTLNYAVTDRLAPRHKNLVMGWVWHYFGHQGADMYNGPHDIDRAMARLIGHNVDGSHHWLYSPIYRGRDQKQRLQIAYWQNFLAAHYAGFLSKSHPVQPKIALMMPDWTGYFYRLYQYPKQDWAWTATALESLQLPYHVITEEELELNPATLDDYSLLYVIGSEWTTPTIRERITKFLERGGVVYSNVDSLSLDIPTGQRTEFVEKTFGARITQKFKNGFYPSAQSVEEAEWGLKLGRSGGSLVVQNHNVHHFDDPRAWSTLFARTEPKFLLDDEGKLKRDESGRPLRDPSYQMMRENGQLVRDQAVWKQLDDLTSEMPAEVRGLPQSAIDMRTPPTVRYGNVTATNWGEIDTASIVRGQPIAWWGDKVVGIETDNTIWMGTREGMNIHALSDRMEMHRTTEACNPFPDRVASSCEEHRIPVDVIGRAAIKAKVTRPISLKMGDQLPLNLEVISRVDDKGTMMAVVINHDATDATYDVEISQQYRSAGTEVFDILAGATISKNAAESIRHRIEPWGVSVLLIGNPESLAQIKQVQAELAAKDMSVPQYFLDNPELNTAEYSTPIPPPEK